MTAFDWAAIIGAAAWIPQIIGRLYHVFAVPNLRVIPSEAPEIGYTTYGPIFNLTCAISVTRKDAVIERLVARLRHERGQVIELQWSTLDEALSQLRSGEGLTEVSKHQPAIALKVSTLLLTEKKIGMQDPTFLGDGQKVSTEFHAHLNHVRRINGDRNQVLFSRQFQDLIAYGRDRFPWQQADIRLNLNLGLLACAGIVNLSSVLRDWPHENPPFSLSRPSVPGRNHRPRCLALSPFLFELSRCRRLVGRARHHRLL